MRARYSEVAGLSLRINFSMDTPKITTAGIAHGRSTKYCTRLSGWQLRAVIKAYFVEILFVVTDVYSNLFNTSIK